VLNEAAATNKAFGFELPEDRRAMAGYGCLADLDLEGALSAHDYILGDGFSAASGRAYRLGDAIRDDREAPRRYDPRK
jgi:hypothetical protein